MQQAEDVAGYLVALERDGQAADRRTAQVRLRVRRRHLFRHCHRRHRPGGRSGPRARVGDTRSRHARAHSWPPALHLPHHDRVEPDVRARRRRVEARSRGSRGRWPRRPPHRRADARGPRGAPAGGARVGDRRAHHGAVTTRRSGGAGPSVPGGTDRIRAHARRGPAGRQQEAGGRGAAEPRQRDVLSAQPAGRSAGV